MPISSQYLPSQLHYIIPLAEQHGSDARIGHFDKRKGRHVPYAETLSKKDVGPLRQLYLEMKARGDGPRLTAWIHDKAKDCPSETSWPILGLLFLFDQLGDLGIAPFNDGTVRYREKEHALDWSKLPEKLRYLAGPAEAYGAHQFDNAIMDFLKNRMTSREKAELQAIGIRYQQDWDEINRWLDEYSMVEHREAALVYFTGHLLGLGTDAGMI